MRIRSEKRIFYELNSPGKQIKPDIVLHFSLPLNVVKHNYFVVI